MDDKIKDYFSNRLNYYLSQTGHTQSDLASFMKVSSSTASDWCNGNKIPRVDKLQSMCNWLGISMGDLLESKETLRPVLRQDETELLRMYNNISESHQKDLLAAARVFETGEKLQGSSSDVSGSGDILDDKESKGGIA